MRIETQRNLLLPNPPGEVWRLLSDPSRLSVFAPEIADAWPVADGLLRVVARVGMRRRACKVKPTLDAEKHRLVLESATEGVAFHLEAQLAPEGSGTRATVSLTLQPPDVWKATPKPGGIPRRVVQRLLISFALFAVSATGVVQLPDLGLPQWAEAVAYAFVGLSFVVGAALLTSARAPRQRPRCRRTDGE